MSSQTEHLKDVLPLGPGVRILGLHPSGLIALDKPRGLMTHPNKQGKSFRCLLKAEYSFKEEKYSWISKHGEAGSLVLLNRLDSPTSGVILGALNDDVACTAREQFIRRRVHKAYFAVVLGRPRVNQHLWVDNLRRVRRRNDKLRVRPGDGKLARTRFQWIRNDNNQLGLCLMMLFPETGFTHQIRVQCAVHGYPIVGDRSYGNYKFNRFLRKAGGLNRLFLHAGKISINFTHRCTPASFEVSSPLPEEFNQVLEYNSRLSHA